MLGNRSAASRTRRETPTCVGTLPHRVEDEVGSRGGNAGHEWIRVVRVYPGGEANGTGVPIGKVARVYSSVRETAQRAVIDPYVDFGALDLVGVVVPSGTASDRAVIEANGTLR